MSETDKIEVIEFCESNCDVKENMACKPLVLIVDDEDICLTLTRKMFEQLGVAVLCAHDGIEAVKLYKEHSNEIILVLMDIQMPRMNGVDAFRCLKQLSRNVQVVFASGYVNKAHKKMIDPMGPAGYIRKPPSPAELSEYLELALSSLRETPE